MAEDAIETGWDAIIVGTGMGGAALGWALADKGRRVLLLERGRDATNPDDAESGQIEDAAERLRLGRWPDRIRMTVDGRATELFASLGCGVGGSTVFYGAALERFTPADFDDPAHPHPAGPWPVSYAEFAPWYARAEVLLGAKGTRDPLGDPASPPLPRPPAPAEADAVMMRDFAQAGLHPYRLHVGIAYVLGCHECIAKACPLGCKSDAANRFVRPALATGHAVLRGDCEVVRIESDEGRATAVVYRQDGRERRVTAPIIALAAGTLRTPALLLASATGEHPTGLANGSGLVGRNLMFHASDWMAIWPSRKASAQGPRKTIGISDFHRLEGKRLGQFQSVGLPAGYGNILYFLQTAFDTSRWRWARPLRPFLRVPAKAAARLFGAASIFALILEDMPYPDNRVELDPAQPGRILIHYRIRQELKDRVRVARERIPTILRNRCFWLGPDIRLDDGHPSGTCRFGDDPATSVLDRDCRAHEVDNLYVVDASFMRSSAGVNPSLTIAANALRVADAIDRCLGAVSPAGACAAPVGAARAAAAPSGPR